MIQLVIEIPEQVYNNAKNDMLCGSILLVDSIKNGVVLPKGHGRLIDGDSLKKCFHYGEANTNNENDMIMAVRRIIESAPTVIEADEEEGAE